LSVNTFYYLYSYKDTLSLYFFIYFFKISLYKNKDIPDDEMREKFSKMVYWLFNDLTQLLGHKSFTEFRCHESLKLYTFKFIKFSIQMKLL